ncbi:hypothetical protein J7643_12055 [bacterium]|nr:hypothetical protein [bacterium]
MSTETVSSQPASAAPHNAFNHPRLQELMKKAGTVPGIGQVLLQILFDTVNPADRILGCYYQFDATAGAPGEAAGNYYTCEVVLVTSAYFILINLFPKSHAYRKKKIHTIGEINLKYDPPTMDEIKNVQAGKFLPTNLTMAVNFMDDKGQVVETWQSETTHPEAIRNLFDIQRILSKCVGFPLAQIPAAAVGAQS